MPLVRIPKKYPHKRICIFCGSRNVKNLYCDSCQRFKSLLPYTHHELVKRFIRNPDVKLLALEFNFNSRSALINALNKLRVPVKKYTLNYLLFNYRNFNDLRIDELTSMYEFNSQSIRFLVVYFNSLKDEVTRKKYGRIWMELHTDSPEYYAIEKSLKIHHGTLRLLKKFITDRKIVY